MDERDRQTEANAPPDEEEVVRRLLESAGPRPPIPQEDLDAIASAARLAWKREVGRRGRGRAPAPAGPPAWRRLPALAAALAAALAVAVGLAWWMSGGGAARPTVARVEAVAGPVHIESPAGEPRAVAPGEPIPLGAALRSEAPPSGRSGAERPGPAGEGQAGRASLRLADGTVVRLDAGTRLRFLSASTLELARGAIYVDTGERPRTAAGPAVEVRTPVGTARDVGTRFAVRIVGPAGRAALLVRVRDGAVLTEQGGRAYRTEAGQELVLHRDGTAERRAAAVYGPEWQWVMATAAGFDVEGRTLAEFLAWVSRETGWRIVLAEPGLAESAAEIVLHGGIGELRPDQAPFAVLPGAGLEGELTDGTLIVRPRR